MRWRQLISEGISQLALRIRDITLKAVDNRRDIVPRLTLVFNNSPARHDIARDVVTFDGDALDATVRCAISREALDDHFGAGRDKADLVKTFLANRSTIERMASTKYLSWPIEEPEAILIKTGEIAALKSTLDRR
jgi:hypothetical protein